MQLAAQHDLTLHQMEVKTAHLNAPLDCEIYIKQPESFEVQNASGKKQVYRLKKSLYGLKQSGRNWNQMLHNFLSENNFVQSVSDNCVYTKQTEKEMTVILVWVDDLIVGANSNTLLCKTKQMFKGKFKMKDIGKLSTFLGIDFEQGNGFVKVNQKRYTEKMIEKFEMSDCKARGTLCKQKLGWSESERVDPLCTVKLLEVWPIWWWVPDLISVGLLPGRGANSLKTRLARWANQFWNWLAYHKIN